MESPLAAEEDRKQIVCWKEMRIVLEIRDLCSVLTNSLPSPVTLHITVQMGEGTSGKRALAK